MVGIFPATVQPITASHACIFVSQNRMLVTGKQLCKLQNHAKLVALHEASNVGSSQRCRTLLQ